MSTYSLISYVSFAIGGLLLIVSVFLFFYYKIPKVIGDLTGSNARKGIESISKHNYTANLSRKLTNTGSLKQKNKGSYITVALSRKLGRVSTQKLAKNSKAEETMVLGNNAATETAVLNAPQNDQNSRPETMVLKQGMQNVASTQMGVIMQYEEVSIKGKIVLEKDITSVNSQEIIV